MFMLDLDGFAAVNQIRPRIRRRAAHGGCRAAQEIMPSGAVLARYGGDEFAGALPDTRLDDAFTQMEEFRRRVAAQAFDEYPDLRTTSSAGLAAYPVNGATDVELMREADQALYFAKSTGRNKVSLPLTDSRMVTRRATTATQLERLSRLGKTLKRNEAGSSARRSTTCSRSTTTSSARRRRSGVLQSRATSPRCARPRRLPWSAPGRHVRRGGHGGSARQVNRAACRD
ncbi:MAG: GGDEF domain-containing protein [Chloroflexia bacterium]